MIPSLSDTALWLSRSVELSLLTKATIILMRPQTGEILAMANRPAFDLNLRSEAKPEQMKNRAIIDMMEPGSTFKIVTAAAALNERKVRPDTMLFCENGLWNVGGRPLHDHKGYGDLTVQDVLVKSSNIGAAKLAIAAAKIKTLARGRGTFVHVTDPTKLSDAIANVLTRTRMVK